MKKVGLIGPIGLIGLIGVVTGGFFLYRGLGATLPPSQPQAQSTLKLYSLGEDQKTLAPPKTTFKAAEPVTFVLTFEKKPTSFWPFPKTAHAEESPQNIFTELTFNNGEAKDITVEMKPLAENQVSFSLTKKDPVRFHPGKYQFKVTREAEGKTQTLTQDFVWGVLAINTNKSVFSAGDKVYLQMASLDDQGRTLCNSDLKLEITGPRNSLTTLIPQKSPTCGNNNVTDNPDYFAYYQLPTTNYQLGTYHLKLTNNSNKYSIDDSFEVRKEIPFSVERMSATRINPFKAEYTMNIKITAREDFEGELVEQVPSGFVILNPSEVEGEGSLANASPPETSSEILRFAQNDKDGHKNISWNVNFKSGQTTALSYTYQAPKISPEIFLLGPLSLTSPTSPIFQEARQWQIASDAVTTLFMESGTDATFDGKFYTTFPSTASSDTVLANTRPRSVKCNSGAGNSACQVRFDNNLADAGRRVTVYFNFTNLPTTGTRIIDFKNSAGTTAFSLNIATTGQLRLSTLSTTCKNGSIISTGRWYRVAVSYVITSTTDFSAKAYLNGTQDMAMTQADCTLNATGTDDLFIGWATQPGANLIVNFDDVYLDNGTTVDDPGDIRVTAKLPSTVNNNEFDTTTGTGAVNERPLSTTNRMDDTTSNTPGALQDYTLETATQGDMDISDHTLVARTAWVWASRSSSGAQTTAASIIDNGTETSITLTATAAMYRVITDSATYPSNAAGIGMRAIDGTYDTAFSEGGILFAYIPTGVSKVKFNGIKMQGIQVK